MANKITEDPRIDPRIKEQFKDIDFPEYRLKVHQEKRCLLRLIPKRENRTHDL